MDKQKREPIIIGKPPTDKTNKGIAVGILREGDGTCRAVTMNPDSDPKGIDVIAVVYDRSHDGSYLALRAYETYHSQGRLHELEDHWWSWLYSESRKWVTRLLHEGKDKYWIAAIAAFISAVITVVVVH